MCLTAEQIQQTCGFLVCNDFNAFIYYCTKCSGEFHSGRELEEHITFDHHDEKKFVDGIFVDDGILLDATVPFVPLVETENILNAIHTDTTGTDSMLSDQISNSSTEPITDEFEQKQLKSSLEFEVETSQEVPCEIQNKAISIDESIQSSSSGCGDGSGDCDDPNKSHVNKKSKVKRKRNNDKAHKGTFFCDLCPGQTFRSLEIIKIHMQRHVMNKLRKPCPLCPVRPRNLENHMRYAHTEAKPYKCVFCNASFKNNMGRVGI